MGVWAVKANSTKVSDMFHKEEFQLLLRCCCFCNLQICQQTSWIESRKKSSEINTESLVTKHVLKLGLKE